MTVKSKVPCSSGTPESPPEGEMAIPSGIAPAVTENVSVPAPPLARIVALYAAATVPPGSVDVATSGGPV